MDIPQAHAATGVVCLADPSISSPCPSTPPVFDGPVGQQIRIGVFISGSDGLDGFSITLNGLANQTLLTPAGIDLTGTVLLGTPVIINECLGGQLIHGTTCNPQDTVDTIDLTATSGLGQGLTTTPTTGLLFTAIYNITATNPSGTPVQVGFKTYAKGTSCIGSNTSVPPDTCVAIANGTATPLPETVQTGTTFDNSGSATLPIVTVTASPLSFGPEFPGTSNTATVNATARNGYPSPAGDSVTFSTIGTSGLSATITGTNPCVTGGKSCVVTLSLSASNPGVYSVTVFATYPTRDTSGNPDTLSAYVSLTVVVSDFGFTITPTTLSFISGEIGTATAILSSFNGFAGTVTLSTGLIMPGGLTVTFDPNPVTLSAGQSINSTITFKASPSVQTIYHAQIKATSGSRSKTFSPNPTITVLKPVPDFYFVATPGTIGPIVAGASGVSTLTVTYANLFAGNVGTVSLSLSPSSTKLTADLNMTSLNGTHNVTLTVSALSAASYTVTVTGTNGTTTHAITVKVIVVDFNFTAASDKLTIDQGTSGISTVTVTPLNGFSGSVSLTTTASPGLTISLSKNTIAGGGSANLNVTVPSSLPAGPYNVNVTGTSGSVTHVVQVNVTVLANDFSIVASPTNILARPNTNATSTITLSSVNGFSGTITLTIAVPPGAMASLTATSVIVPKGGAAVSVLNVNASSLGVFLVNVTGVSGSLSHTARLNFTSTNNDFSISASPTSVFFVAGGSGTATITVTAVGTFSGNVSLTASASPGLVATLTPKSIKTSTTGTAVLNLSASQVGNYTVTVTGTSGVLFHSTDVIVQVQNFTIAASPAVVQVNLPQTASASISVVAVNHFAGTVSLVTDSTSCTLSPGSATAAVPSTLSCTFSKSGSYTVKVTGTSGPFSRNIFVTINVGDFVITLGESLITVPEGSSGSVLVNLASENGFAGTIGLSAVVVEPPGFAGVGVPIVTFSPSTVTLTSGISKNVSLIVNVGDNVLPQIFEIRVNATIGLRVQLSAPISLTVPIPEFSIIPNPKTFTTAPGVPGTSIITITSQGGLFGPVSLTPNAPSGASCSFTVPSLTLHVNGSNSTVLSCTGTVGSYNVTIAGVGTQPNGGQAAIVGSAMFVVADFSLTPTPTTILINTAQPGHARISISWTNSYPGNVTLRLTPAAGLDASLTSTTVRGSGNANLTVSSNTAGVYSLVVNATSGNLSHTVTLTVNINSPAESPAAPLALYSGIGVLLAAIAAGAFLARRRGKGSRKKNQR